MTIPFKGGRPWGLPKTGGRQKGTPNKATLTVQEKLDSIGCDPIIELAKLGMNEKFTEEFRRRCFSDLASYICPKPKPADLTTTPERPVINVNTNLDNSDDSVRNAREPEPAVATVHEPEINVQTNLDNSGYQVDVRDNCEPQSDADAPAGSGIKKP
jgi:hypothetical protein